ncbi:MAG: nucleotidyl transferase AbiEii/AbiGii toxin family protein [Candidatus Neomarinimicrobiota bacterium]
MKLKRFSYVLLISLSLVSAQVSKQKILLSDVSNPKTEIKVLSESEGEITIQFNVDDFYSERLETESGAFSKLTFEGTKSTTELGKSQLPVFRKIIELPYDANPTVEIVSSTIEKFNIAENRSITKTSSDYFELSAKGRVLSFADVYGGKICAALDRQHPRDLFDI